MHINSITCSFKTKGYSLTEAYEDEIVHYDINSSLFDVVVSNQVFNSFDWIQKFNFKASSVVRFIILCLFYVCLNCIHWFPVAVSIQL